MKALCTMKEICSGEYSIPWPNELIFAVYCLAKQGLLNQEKLDELLDEYVNIPFFGSTSEIREYYFGDPDIKVKLSVDEALKEIKNYEQNRVSYEDFCKFLGIECCYYDSKGHFVNHRNYGWM